MAEAGCRQNNAKTLITLLIDVDRVVLVRTKGRQPYPGSRLTMSAEAADEFTLSGARPVFQHASLHRSNSVQISLRLSAGWPFACSRFMYAAVSKRSCRGDPSTIS